MSQISLITPPDRLYTDHTSLLLICPSNFVKEQLQNVLAQLDEPMHVYLYELTSENQEPEWLLDVFQAVDYTIIDIDNCQPSIRDIASYFLSKDKTYWLTKAEGKLYNIINKNRIYDLDFLIYKIGGNLEKK